MMKLLEKWMQEYEDRRLAQLKKTQECMDKWRTEKRAQKTLDVNYESYHRGKEPVIIPEMRQFSCATISPNWKRVTEQASVKDYNNGLLRYKLVDVSVIIDQIKIDGVFYDDYITGGDYWRMKQKYNGYEKLLKDHGCTMSDANWLEIGRSELDMQTKAHKDMLQQKKAIESKVRKICGETLVEVDDSKGEIYAKGSNGRVAHIWAINAGGWNIQCLHIRVLVKEVK